MYIDPIYWYFALPGLLATFLAQMYVMYTYNKYSNLDAGKDMTGLDIAKKLRDEEQFPVSIATNQGKLEDNFDPINNVVRISSDNVTSKSVANIAVVAHEFGHVQQKFSSSLVYKIRRVMVPITQVGTQIGYVLFIIGIVISALRISEIGLIFFSTGVLFSFVTLPVEFDASNRAMKMIRKYNLMDKYSEDGAKQVLTAAALTYVAGLLTSILNLLYYVNVLNKRR